MTTTKPITPSRMAARTALILFLFVLVFTSMLSGAYLWTRPALEAQREALLADFQAAWSAYAGGGVFCKAAHGSATLEFIEGQVHK